MHAALASRQLLHRGHGLGIEAAGPDELEVAEVGVDIEGEPMEGDPIGDGDAYRGKLLPSRPHACVALLLVCGDTEIRGSPDQDLLEPPEELVHVELDQPDDWVADELSRGVPGGVPA